MLVNPVNCAGVMGKGLALEFKLRYPAMYTCCRMACLEQELKPGGLLVWRSCTGWVVSLATKDDWRAPSSYAWVAACLAALRDLSCPVSGGYVALPTFRCGNGGLDWARVKPLIEGPGGPLQQDSRVCSPVLSTSYLTHNNCLIRPGVRLDPRPLA